MFDIFTRNNLTVDKLFPVNCTLGHFHNTDCHFIA
jgi:hypothetical protein